MTDLLHEQLSALIDGELPASETTLLLKRLTREPGLRERLARYRVCGETLRGARVQAKADFTLRVCAVLASEPCHAASDSSRRPQHARSPLARFLRPIAGLAVAAAVAAVAILAVGRPGASDPLPAQTAANRATPAAAPGPAPVAVPVADESRAKGTATPGEGGFVFAQNSNGEPPSYVTPAPHRGLNVIPQAELANYVVVHSAVGGSLGFPTGLNDLVSAEPFAAGVPAR